MRQVGFMVKKVLIVDDDPAFCEIARTYIEQLGVETIFVVHNARYALRILKNERHIDLIILDLNMPDMDGIELLNEISDTPFSGAVAIVSVETPVIINMAETLANVHGITVLDAVRKPLTKHQVDDWFAQLSA